MLLSLSVIHIKHLRQSLKAMEMWDIWGKIFIWIVMKIDFKGGDPERFGNWFHKKLSPDCWIWNCSRIGFETTKEHWLPLPHIPASAASIFIPFCVCVFAQVWQVYTSLSRLQALLCPLPIIGVLMRPWPDQRQKWGKMRRETLSFEKCFRWIK